MQKNEKIQKKEELTALKKRYDTRGIVLIVAGCILTLGYIFGIDALRTVFGSTLLLVVPMIVAFVPFVAAVWFWHKSAQIQKELGQPPAESIVEDAEEEEKTDEKPEIVGDDGIVPDDEPEEEPKTETEEE